MQSLDNAETDQWATKLVLALWKNIRLPAPYTSHSASATQIETPGLQLVQTGSRTEALHAAAWHARFVETSPDVEELPQQPELELSCGRQLGECGDSRELDQPTGCACPPSSSQLGTAGGTDIEDESDRTANSLNAISKRGMKTATSGSWMEMIISRDRRCLSQRHSSNITPIR